MTVEHGATISGGVFADELKSLMIDAEASVIILEASRCTVGIRLSMSTNAYLGPPPPSNVALNL